MEKHEHFDNQGLTLRLPKIRPSGKKIHSPCAKFTRGFTLVELLVVFFIMASLLAMVIPGYFQHSTQLELENLALDIALTIREAQAYGTGAKVLSSGSEDFDTRYGVHFDKNSNQFIIFENTSEDVGNENVYTDGSGVFLADSKIQTLTIKSGYSINNICDSPSLCTNRSLDIVFKRPNGEASLKTGSTEFVDGAPSAGVANVIIELLSPDNVTLSIYVQRTGNVAIRK